jgi:cyclophilin family peptidyl-prolyl cis-trans isomerase
MKPSDRRQRSASNRASSQGGGLGRPLAILALLGIGGGLSFWLASRTDTEESPGPVAARATRSEPRPPATSSDSTPPTRRHTSPTTPTTKKQGGTFLDDFDDPENPGSKEDKNGSALSNKELEKRFDSLVEMRERRTDPEELSKVSEAFQKDVAKARETRPDDPVPEWLTGELLIFVSGTPEEILPHFRKASAGGLKRPRFLASLSRVELHANHVAAAYAAALAALDQAPEDRYVWNAFHWAALANEQFGTIVERLDKAFPAQPPEWTTPLRREAASWQARWEKERELRAAEERGNNLPRVRLLIEHRRFAGATTGSKQATIESTGTEEVIVELFQDQAPVTVANFLDLVDKGFYDGTKFHLAEAATWAVGGGPRPKDDATEDDSDGGPGYVIADEYQLPDRRDQFRGALGMLNAGPGTAGSQFFISIAPVSQMNGRFTIFGRVIKGQEAVDNITLGRNSPKVGQFGKIIPGDILVKAEVLPRRAPGDGAFGGWMPPLFQLLGGILLAAVAVTTGLLLVMRRRRKTA